MDECTGSIRPRLLSILVVNMDRQKRRRNRLKNASKGARTKMNVPVVIVSKKKNCEKKINLPYKIQKRRFRGNQINI